MQDLIALNSTLAELVQDMRELNSILAEGVEQL